MNIDYQIKEIVNKLKEMYPSDQTTPGVLISFINNSKYYVAAQRFPTALGSSEVITRIIVAKAVKDNIEEAILSVKKVLQQIQESNDTIKQ